MENKTILEWAETFQEQIQNGASQSDIVQLIEEYSEQQLSKIATPSQSEVKCEAGCKHFEGGEVKHHKDCKNNPQSGVKEKTAEEILEVQTNAEGSLITEFIGKDGYVWRMILNAMKQHAAQQVNHHLEKEWKK